MALPQEKPIANVDIVWKQHVQAWVDGQIVCWKHIADAGSVLLLRDVLAPSLALLCVGIVVIDIEEA